MRFGKKAKRRLSVAMALLLLLFECLGAWPFARLPGASAAPAWPATTGLIMPFAPSDGLVTTQNPPDFHWPAMGGTATYDLQISRSQAFTVVPYERIGLPKNVYNFPAAFNPGTWYWRVRYNKPATGASEWSGPYKFRIKEQNAAFGVPTVDQIMNAIGQDHPRIWATDATLLQFRSLAQTTGKTVYDAALASYTANIANFPPEPPAGSGLKNAAIKAVDMMANAAFLYLATGTETYAEHALQRLRAIAGWDTDGSTSYESQDQVHRYIAYKSAMAYDWLFDSPAMTTGDKETIRNMIVTRTTTMFEDLTQDRPLMSNPYDSHGWTAYGYIGIIAVALLHDTGLAGPAKDWFREVIPVYINLLPPWGGEYGGWSQGTGYWQNSSMFGKEFMDVLYYASGINLYEKAYSRNEGLFPLYMFPHGSPGGVFGDGSQDRPGKPSVSVYNRLAQMKTEGDPRLKWAAEAIGTGPGGELANYFYGDDDPDVMPPVDLPDSRWFRDAGMVAMHSKLYDPDRISLYFKSSPYGSFNHSHADQNSFVVNAFGEALAIESGFYDDDYNSPHDLNYAKQTFASNAMTYNGKIGQPVNHIDADGLITGFVTHPDFDAASGDAKAAYQAASSTGGALVTQANRKIIYVRPSQFVVIDQLAVDPAATPGEVEFEWRLHAEDELNLDADRSGATILKGNAGLKVRLHTPSGLRSLYEDKFLDQNGIERKPGGKYANEEQKHVAFITPKTTATTIVSTMQAYKRDAAAPPAVIAENHGSYIKLPFADGTAVYVRISGSDPVDTGDLTFDGAAMAVKGDTLLLVDGTKIVRDSDGVELIRSSETATVVYGKKRLSISSQADTEVKLQAPAIARLRDEAGIDIAQGGTLPETFETAFALRGAYWTYSGGKLTVNAERGERSFALNDAPMPEPAENPVNLAAIIDGVPGQISMQSHTDREGVPVSWGKLDNASGLYEVVQAPPGLLFVSGGSRSSLYLEADASIVLRGAATGVLELRSVAQKAADLWSDPDEKRIANPIVWTEAESFRLSGGKDFNKYASQPFLSGGVGLGDWNQRGQWAKWSLVVPKAGTYDLTIKYARPQTMPDGTTKASLYAMIGNKPYYFELPSTGGYGGVPNQWRSLRVRTNQLLPAGAVDIVMWNAAGLMNADWIGLLEDRSDEVQPSAPAGVQATQNGAQANVTWSQSTDNAAITGYAIYAKESGEDVGKYAQKAEVPTGSLSAPIYGLAIGKSYDVTVRAVDSSGNRSPASAAASVEMQDKSAPAWEASDAIRVVHKFSNAAKLEWDAASDANGTVASYVLYRKEQPGGTFGSPVDIAGNAYDATGLEPNKTYAFKVEAKDGAGNVSSDGPAFTLAMPTASQGGDYYETFDLWPAAPANGGGWTFAKTGGTTVETVSLAGAAGKALNATDNLYDPLNEYVPSPVIQRKTSALSGKATFETRFRFDALSHPFGNFEILLGGADTDLIRFSYNSDGSLAYWKYGVATSFRIPDADFDLPSGQWATLRFDVDMTARTYDIILQMDALKTYTGTPATGAVDASKGEYRIAGLPFSYNQPAVTALDSFVFKSSRYTGKYYLDYAAMYKRDEVAPAWGGTAAVQADHKFSEAVRLTWTDASDASGAVAGYLLYQQGRTDPIAEVAGNSYDVTGLTPGASYTFKVEAKDGRGNRSANGPSLALTLPSVNAGGDYYDTFDGWPIGVAGSGRYWTFATKKFDKTDTAVGTVAMPQPGNQALKVTDNYYALSDEYAASPIVQRTTAPMNGNVTFETRFRFDPLDHGAGTFELMLGGSGTDLVRFTGYSDGTFGYWRKLTGTNAPLRIPASGFKLPQGQWITLRFDVNMATKMFDITLQADALKSYVGAPADGAALNTATGVYRITGLSFFDDNTSVSALDSFVFRPGRFTGQYTFDYATMYRHA